MEENNGINPPAPEKTSKSKKLRVKNKGIKKNKDESSTLIPENSVSSTDVCAICLSPFVGKLIGTIKNCKHTFCLQCLRRWTNVNRSCPLDRKKCTVIQIRKNLGGKVLRSENIKFSKQMNRKLTNNQLIAMLLDDTDSDFSM